MTLADRFLDARLKKEPVSFDGAELLLISRALRIASRVTVENVREVIRAEQQSCKNAALELPPLMLAQAIVRALTEESK